MWIGVENRPMTTFRRLELLRRRDGRPRLRHIDFAGLLLNWAGAVRGRRLHRQLAYTWSDAPVLLLPRVASSAVKIDKINVIGERQRFGASVLAAGLSVVSLGCGRALAG